MDRQILDFLLDKLAAHEGGGQAIIISYDDATFNYLICQHTKILGCSKDLARAFQLAISGKRFDD